MVTRRKFLQQSSILAGAFMMNDTTEFLKMHKDLGLQLYTVRDEIKDLANTLQIISAAGYTNIEM